MVSETITHRVHPVSAGLKRNLLAHMLRHEADAQALVFVDTKLGCARLAHFLERHGIAADAIHGDKGQAQRTDTLEAFKSGKLRVLVATDVAARGLDIYDLPMVINFELPHTAEDYVHRIGRTGRAGKQGNAISLVCAEEKHRLTDIERLIKLQIPQEPVPGFEPDPEFFEAGSRARHTRRGAAAHSPEAASEAPVTERAPRQAAPREAGPREAGPREPGPRGPAARQSAPVRSGDSRRRGGRSTIAADGFDYTKPYEPTAEAGQLPGASEEFRAGAPRRHARPIAVLLGGLGRK
jgi:ATP-dependent RNA helicase RhlE